MAHNSQNTSGEDSSAATVYKYSQSDSGKPLWCYSNGTQSTGSSFPFQPHVHTQQHIPDPGVSAVGEGSQAEGEIDAFPALVQDGVPGGLPVRVSHRRVRGGSLGLLALVVCHVSHFQSCCRGFGSFGGEASRCCPGLAQ